MTPRWPRVGVGGVVIDESRLLMVKRGAGAGRGLWSVPGGHVKPGETLSAALEREVAEETSVAVTCGEFLGWVEIIEDEYHYLVMDFLATPLVAVEPVPGDDAREARWVPLGEVADLKLVPGLAEFLSSHGISQ